MAQGLYIPYRPRIKPRFLQGFSTIGNASDNVKRWHDKKGLPYPVLFLPMWEGSGNVCYDLSGDGYHLDRASGILWSGGSFLCDNDTDYFISSSAPRDDGTAITNLTVFNIFSIGSGTPGPSGIWKLGGTINGIQLLYRTAPDTVGYAYETTSGADDEVASSTTFAENINVLIKTAATVSSVGSFKLYVNGKLEDTGTVSGTFSHTTSDCGWGKASAAVGGTAGVETGNGFIGKGDFAAVYFEELSAEQINLLNEHPCGALYPITVPSYFFFGAAAPGGAVDNILPRLYHYKRMRT